MISWTAVNYRPTCEYLNVQCLAVSGNNIFAGTDGSGIYLSTDNGTSWIAANNGIANTTVYCLAMNVNHIFAATGGPIYLSINNGKSWTVSDSNLAANCLAVSDSNIFVGFSGVYLSTNNGKTWNAAADYGLTYTLVTSLAVSGSTIFAGTDPGSTGMFPYGGGVFFSTNNGTSWTAIDSGITRYVSALAVSGSTIFAAFDEGVFFSTNNGKGRTMVNFGLGGREGRATSLAVSDSNIFAVTIFGGIGSVWRRPLSQITRVINSKSQNEMLQQANLKISPSNTTHIVTIEFYLLHSDQVSLKIYNLSGREILTWANRSLSSGAQRFSWNKKDAAAGCYVIRLQVGSNVCIKNIPISM